VLFKLLILSVNYCYFIYDVVFEGVKIICGVVDTFFRKYIFTKIIFIFTCTTCDFIFGFYVYIFGGFILVYTCYIIWFLWFTGYIILFLWWVNQQILVFYDFIFGIL